MDVDNSDGEAKPSSSKINASINNKKNSIVDESSSASSKLNVSDNQNSSSNVKSESERTLNLNTPSTSALKDKDDIMCNLNKNSVCNLTTIVNVNNTISGSSEIKTEIEIKEEDDEAAGRSTINSVLPPHAISKFGVSLFSIFKII